MCPRRLLTSAVYNPRNVLVFAAMGDGCELAVQSAGAFAHEGEALSYWQLQVVHSLRLACCCTFDAFPAVLSSLLSQQPRRMLLAALRKQPDY